MGALTSVQVSGFNTSAVLNLSTDQVVALGTDLGGLNTTQVQVLTTAQAAALTSAQIQALTSAQIGAFSTAAIAALGDTQIQAIETRDISGLKTTQIQALLDTQVDALTNDQIIALTTSQAAALSTAAVTALSTSQISVMETRDLAAFTVSQVQSLKTTQIVALTGSQVGALTTTQFSNLDTAQLSAIEVGDIASLTTRQIASMTDTQASKLTTSQVDALDTAQAAALTVGAIAAMTTAQIVALGADIAGLKTTQIVALTTAQTANLTNAQLGALTTRQMVAIDAADLAALSTTQLGVLMGSVTTAQVSIGSLNTAQLAALASPIMLDLDRDGIETLSLNPGVQFDLRATGQATRNGWVGPDDGLLVRDLNDNGRIDDGTELFGTATRLANGEKGAEGYVALRELDSNGDGAITAADEAWSELKVWQDSNSDGVSQAGELKSLTDDIGIKRLDLNAQTPFDSNGNPVYNNGNWVGLVSSFETLDGQTHEMADVWFKVETAEVQTAGDDLRTQVSDMVQAMAEFATGTGTPTGTTVSLTDTSDQTTGFAAHVAIIATTLTNFMQSNPDFGINAGMSLASASTLQEPGKSQTDLLAVSPMLTSSS
ncbi:hypothetical protein [uncultured Thiocystis sp.]|uniref:hypothetical protein n=1 Tax=uncultured Thiocystis sp. TaxID=1202134 RepID=UPI0025E0DFAD|nr:hypothetical protein [uncultured Thiocystis sp.]